MNQWTKLEKTQGSYVLVLEVPSSLEILIKRFKWELKPGLYLYFGSAKGSTATSLGNRLHRHFKDNKKIFWHIDHLTSNKEVNKINAFYTIGLDLSECEALQKFKQDHPKCNILLNFGSSDCKSSCGGHLLHLLEENGSIAYLKSYFSQKKWLTIMDE